MAYQVVSAGNLLRALTVRGAKKPTDDNGTDWRRHEAMEFGSVHARLGDDLVFPPRRRAFWHGPELGVGLS
jgi:hypothetical protein